MLTRMDHHLMNQRKLKGTTTTGTMVLLRSGRRPWQPPPNTHPGQAALSQVPMPLGPWMGPVNGSFLPLQCRWDWGRWRSATKEDELGTNKIARNYYTGGTNVLVANFHTNNHGNSGERYSTGAATRTQNQCRLHYHPFLHEPRVRPFDHGSPFDEDQALRSFQAQLRQFDRGSSNRPSTQCLSRSQLATVHPRGHNRGSILRAS
jgi:hypothetical protein